MPVKGYGMLWLYSQTGDKERGSASRDKFNRKRVALKVGATLAVALSSGLPTKNGTIQFTKGRHKACPYNIQKNMKYKKQLFFLLLLIILLPMKNARAVLLCNPLSPDCGEILPFELAARIVKALLGFVGIMALMNFVIAGMTFIWSRGSEKNVSQARDNLIWTTIGIVTIFSSYAVLSFLIETLTKPA